MDKIIVLIKSFLISLMSIADDFEGTPILESRDLETDVFLADASPPDFNCARNASTSRLNSLVFFVSNFDISK